MAKFCGKCGAKLDEATGLCPNCDADKLNKQNEKPESVEESKPKRDTAPKSENPLSKKEAKKQRKSAKKAAKKAKKKEKWASMTFGQKVQRVFLKLLLGTILFIALACGIVGTLYYFDVVDIPYISMLLDIVEKKDCNTDLNLDFAEFKNIEGMCVTRSIFNEKDALAAIEDVSEVIGIKNVNEEFSDCNRNNVLGNCYYRFEQKYKNIPVYGRNLSVSADCAGNCLMITGNYLSFDSIDMQVIFSDESAEKLLQDSYENITSIYNNGLTIYSLDDVVPEQAWSFYVISSGEMKNVFISTVSGKVLAEIPMTYTEKADCFGKDVNDNIRHFIAEKEGNTYILQDNTRGISVYDAHKSTVEKEGVIVASNGKKFHIDKDGQNLVDEAGNVVTVSGENYSLVIQDASGNQIGTNGWFDLVLTAKNIFTNITPVTSRKIDWSNKKAVTLMADISAIYDFWYENFDRVGFDGKNGKVKAVYDDFKNLGKEGLYLLGDTENADSQSIDGLTVLCFGIDNSLSTDTIGHEYMHSVEKSISNMNYKSESGALMEAYSDIFGEIMEDWIDDNQLNNSCDWIHGSRNIINPSLISYPVTYQGSNWVNTADTGKKNDHGGVHKNSTVISHAAYLMWTGIGGNPAFESLGTKDLAELFYSSLFALPSNCTFAQFRTVLQNTADILCFQRKITNKQRLCVSNAMFQVGISSEPVVYPVLEEFELYTYGIDEELYDDYSILIKEIDLDKMPQGPKIKPIYRDVTSYNVQSAEPYTIRILPGVYEITLKDNKNNTSEVVFNVITNKKDGMRSIPVDTVFGGIQDRNKDDNHSVKLVPSDAVEFNGHYYKYFDESGTWDVARGYCEAQGGYLAVITSEEEQEFLTSYIAGKEKRSYWIGLSDAAEPGNYRWVNGEPFGYYNWAQNEPNHGYGGDEHYVALVSEDTEFDYPIYCGEWNDHRFNDRDLDQFGFICEWGEYESMPQTNEPTRTTSDERDIVLVLDVSGSMAGTPITETQKASVSFIDTILDEDASIGIVTYDNSASMLSDFSVDQTALTEAVSGIWSGGGTNIEAGLAEARAMLNTSEAKKKIIVLMSDGEPNSGKEGDALISYADEIKNEGIIIYTLGFFESLGSYKSSAQILMDRIASDGCHYEVASADELVFFFGDIADQLNGQKYIYVRIACPVDVVVTHNGETLCSSSDNLNMRTEFGTLTFEDNDDSAIQGNSDDRIKVLRLKEGADYDVKISGTGHGLMDYTIGFMDENGDYSDFRKFENIKITRRTEIDTVAAVSKESVLNIDEDGDGKYDLKLRAEENGYGEEVKQNYMRYIVIVGIVLPMCVFVGFFIHSRKKRKDTVN